MIVEDITITNRYAIEYRIPSVDEFVALFKKNVNEKYPDAGSVKFRHPIQFAIYRWPFDENVPQTHWELSLSGSLISDQPDETKIKVSER